MASDTKNVNSIIKASKILKCLSRGKARMSEIHKDLGYSKGTIHRLLKTLITVGFVVQDPITSEYFLGPLVFQLQSNPVNSHGALINCAFEEMSYLRDYTKETILLHIPSGFERVCIEQLESPERVKYVTQKGASEPLYVGSAGKILLAAYTDEDIQAILRNISWRPITSRTITKPEVLFDEIRKGRKKGFTISFGERAVGAASVSVPIKAYVSPVALSVLGPENRLTINKIKKLIDRLKKSAD